MDIPIPSTPMTGCVFLFAGDPGTGKTAEALALAGPCVGIGKPNGFRVAETLLGFPAPKVLARRGLSGIPAAIKAAKALGVSSVIVDDISDEAAGDNKRLAKELGDTGRAIFDRSDRLEWSMGDIRELAARIGINVIYTGHGVEGGGDAKGRTWKAGVKLPTNRLRKEIAHEADLALMTEFTGTPTRWAACFVHDQTERYTKDRFHIVPGRMPVGSVRAALWQSGSRPLRPPRPTGLEWMDAAMVQFAGALGDAAEEDRIRLAAEWRGRITAKASAREGFHPLQTEWVLRDGLAYDFIRRAREGRRDDLLAGFLSAGAPAAEDAANDSLFT